MILLRNLSPDSCIPSVCGLVLLGASALKAYTLASGPVPETDLWSSRWFLSAVAEGELALGLALLTGFYPRVMRLLALVCFGIFFEVNLCLALSGQKDCFCFGKLPVSPWVMAGFDLVAALALFLCKSEHTLARTVHSHPLVFAFGLMLIAVLGIPAALAMNREKTDPHLRRDPNLRARLDLDAKNPTRQEILDRLSAATGLAMATDKRLAESEPSLGFVNFSVVPAWSVMKWLAYRQGEAHWRKVEGGYELTPLPWWHKIDPWLLGFSIFVTEVVGVFVFYCSKRRSAVVRLAVQKA